MVEVLAPKLRGIGLGDELLIHDARNRIGCVDGLRLRDQLLEFLKFRDLAAQHGFFVRASFEERRSWLLQHHPQALMLDDSSLQSVWDRARKLYIEP